MHFRGAGRSQRGGGGEGGGGGGGEEGGGRDAKRAANTVQSKGADFSSPHSLSAHRLEICMFVPNYY